LPCGASSWGACSTPISTPARGLGRWGVAAEVYGYTSGSAGAGQGGLLGAVTVRPAEWLVVDGGGVVGLGAAGRDQLFLGVTTNLGRIFK